MKGYGGGGKRLTSKETARLLGVSEASIKRWADGGLLPSEKTAGGHRRFRPEDVATFRRGKGVPDANERAAATSATATSQPRRVAARARFAGDAELLAEATFGALLDGSAEKASALLTDAHASGRGLAALFDEVLSPAMRRVGDLWHEGELTVAQEHVATRAALSALQTLGGALAEAEPFAPLAVCCGAEEDFHELPVNCSELVLREGGWAVLNLGANTPFYALAEAVARRGPRLVAVAATVLADLDRAVREFKDLRAAAARAGATVVLGGAGFADAAVRRRLPADLHADSFTQLSKLSEKMSKSREP